MTDDDDEDRPLGEALLDVAEEQLERGYDGVALVIGDIDVLTINAKLTSFDAITGL